MGNVFRDVVMRPQGIGPEFADDHGLLVMPVALQVHVAVLARVEFADAVVVEEAKVDSGVLRCCRDQ